MKFRSCNWIMHGLNFEPEHIEECCLRCHVGGGQVIIRKEYNGEPINWDEFWKEKKKFIDENKKGIMNPRCEGCFNIEEHEWDEGHYFNYMHFNHWTHCNSNCIYCYTNTAKDYFNHAPHYNVFPLVKEIFEKGMFKHGGEITFAGGEPTILEEFEDLMNFFVENKVSNITIHTSGVKYSPALARGIKEGLVNVVVSLDSGTKEAYIKAKRFNHYDKVWENVAKYAANENDKSSNNVSTKMIFMQGINDNEQEVEAWLMKNVEAKTNCVVIDIEHEWFKLLRANRTMPDNIRNLIKYIKKRTDELGLKLIDYNSARYLIENPNYFTKNEMIKNPYL